MQSNRFLMGRRCTCALAAGLITCMTASTAFSDDIFVDVDAAGLGNGLNWANAYNYLQDALADAEADDVIWVAEGTYRPDEDDANPNGTGSKDATFQLVDDVELYGGFDGTEIDVTERDPAVNITILSGVRADEDPADGCDDDPDIIDGPCGDPEAGDCFTGNGTRACENSRCCQAVCDDNPFCCCIEWDTICAEIALDLEECGGVAHVVTAGVEITDLTVIDGFTIRDGFANANDDGFDPDDDLGGGMLILGAPHVVRCIFQDNKAQLRGGGVAIAEELVEPEFINCVFIDNEAGLVPFEGSGRIFLGGGLANDRGAPTLTNCLFFGNKALQDGGAIYHLGAAGGQQPPFPEMTLFNCTIADNTAGGLGGGVRNLESATFNADNCIFYDNIDKDGQIETSQIFGGTDVNVNYSDIEGLDQITGTGNIDDDPDFVNAASGDYRLQDTSPCINAGDPDDSIIPVDEFDLDNNADNTEPTPELDLLMRVQALVDMGAYENDACPWDLDGDCIVGTLDLLILLGRWNDPFVSTDLIELLGTWGPCPCALPGVTVPSLQEAFEDACLDWPDDWNDVKDALGTEDQDNYLCWLDHYLNHCSNCFCPHAGSVDCSGDDPFN